ncbi:YcxB family protein [Streptomyces fuscigenes]|uniref:YcxB family protein n=1 Tax=Streptomyces fuscigenes TaxID=1528880 RepID=UPI001F3B9349|nr:YcxB family protein [Streptomyces fuscigenes]MCF3961190.1 YcxB family protein [Streptomyces fuscigenes]
MTVEQHPNTADAKDSSDAVQLAYHATRDQIAETFRTRRKASPAGRRRRVMTFVAAALWTVYVVLAAVNGYFVDTSLPLLIVAAGACAVVFLLRRAAVRSVYKLRQQRGEQRITVSGEGVRVATGLDTTRVPWAQLKGYAETDDIFVLMHTGAHTINTTPLPKSAVSRQGDVDRLRELLDHGTTRLGGRPRG